METELIAILATITLGWAGWISITVINNQKEIKALSSLGTQFTQMNEKIDGLSSRVDLFLKTEVDTLKKLAE